MVAPLAHDVLTAPGAHPTRAVLFLHGILGRRSNWRSIARRFLKERPEYAAVLVDLRAHGDSPAGPAPHTVRACAEDVLALAESLPYRLHGLLGHSFGGKVALAAGMIEPLDALYIIDSSPSPNVRRWASSTVSRVLSILRALPREPLSDKDAFIAHIEGEGIERGVALWLAMNLERVEGGVRFGVDLAVVDELLEDYFDVDLWRPIEQPSGRVELVVGARSDVYGTEDLARARAAADADDRVNLVVAPEAGHWVHAETPEVVVKAIVRGAELT